jgi:DNA polymerase-3 subunit alpha (Gram-positive type)
MLGAKRVSDIGPLMISTESQSNVNRQPKHIILLVKEQKGIINLYELVSRAHLEHFWKYPIIPKSLLIKLRDGLLYRHVPLRR